MPTLRGWLGSKPPMLRDTGKTWPRCQRNARVHQFRKAPVVTGGERDQPFNVVRAFEPVVVKGKKACDRFFGRLLAVVNRGVEVAVGQPGDLARGVEVVVRLDELGAHQLTFGVIHR